MSKQRLIKVVDYQVEWPSLYEQAAQEIRNILKDELLEIHHIGSTSVPGLAAKPIIDIMPIVKDIQKIDQYQSLFQDIGYTAMGEYGISGRRFFLRGMIERSHHIHIFDFHNQKDIERHLALAKYLRSHPSDRDAYSTIKKEMAKKFPHDIDGYCEGKDAFVKDIERKALLLYPTNNINR